MWMMKLLAIGIDINVINAQAFYRGYIHETVFGPTLSLALPK
tara:strand:+ start:1010 stop:1135 length:126 start_codon:yes stop_codon:yes gene_type:complete